MKIRITIQNKDTEEEIFRDYEFENFTHLNGDKILYDMIDTLERGDKDEKIPF